MARNAIPPNSSATVPSPSSTRNPPTSRFSSTPASTSLTRKTGTGVLAAGTFLGRRKAEDGLYEDIDPPEPRLEDPAVFEALPDFIKNSLNRRRYFWRWDTPEKYDANLRARYRMITGMDRIIGRIRDALNRRGLSDNTVIVFSADNGYYRGERGLAGKWTHFEESLRVPLIVFDPSLPAERRGRVVDALALNLDFPSTFLDYAGVPIPPSYRGHSLRPLIEGEVPDAWRTEFFAEHQHFAGGIIPGWSGVRGERYVYARYGHQSPPYEFLHDLETDPLQLENFADDPEYREILERMRAKRAAYVERYTRQSPKSAAETKSAAEK